MNKHYRNNGAIGAILDEYEKAIDELLFAIKQLSNDQLTKIIDSTTDDKDCQSIQTILTHLVQSGYTYVIEIRKWLGEKIDYKEKMELQTVDAYAQALKEMFHYNEQLFNDYPDLTLYEYEPNRKIHVRWGQKYDVDQLFEHATMHIHRHRRQIERFKLKLSS